MTPNPGPRYPPAKHKTHSPHDINSPSRTHPETSLSSPSPETLDTHHAEALIGAEKQSLRVGNAAILAIVV